MRKTLVLCLLIVPFCLVSDDEDFSYSNFSLLYNGGESTGATIEASMGLPFGLYLSGSVQRSDDQIEDEEFEKNSEAMRLGFHFSIADIFKQISYKKVNIEIARFLDFYFELGPKKWELVDNVNVNKTGTDFNFVGGVRIGDSESWEANLFLDKSKQAEIEKDPTTNQTQYGSGEVTERILGFKVIRNFNKHTALVFEAMDKRNSGNSYSLGFRYKF